MFHSLLNKTMDINKVFCYHNFSGNFAENKGEKTMIVSSGYRKNGFDANGGKLLQKKDMDFWMNLPERTDPSGVCFELGDEVEEVEQGFFELVPTICELWILNPNCRLYLSETEKALFQKNNVLIRGTFDTSAEAFAKENRLRFLHIDTVIAREGDFFERGTRDRYSHSLLLS